MIVAVAERGRLQFEALILAQSLANARAAAPVASPWDLILAEPQPGPVTSADPRMDADVRRELMALGAEILPFTARHFGDSYPHGNKIEALGAMPAGRPFLFVDTDTVFLRPPETIAFDFARPSASLRREDTWPKPVAGGPNRAEIWGALYCHFGLDIGASLDPDYDPEDWRHYLYFNAGFFFGANARGFGAAFLEIARGIRDAGLPELAGQTLYPWLDQIALPLVIHRLGGGRGGAHLGHMDGDVSCHWRAVALAFARESDAVVSALEAAAAPNRIKRILKRYPPYLKGFFRGDGARARALFAGKPLPENEREIRKALKAAGLWHR